jgi:hypothetical protein
MCMCGCMYIMCGHFVGMDAYDCVHIFMLLYNYARIQHIRTCIRLCVYIYGCMCVKYAVKYELCMHGYMCALNVCSRVCICSTHCDKSSENILNIWINLFTNFRPKSWLYPETKIYKDSSGHFRSDYLSMNGLYQILATRSGLH